ncbi:unnamed protein product, partial [Prorocentrum cordatum]
RKGSQSFRCAVAEMQGWRVSHEDAHEMRCSSSWAAWWVLDGHGGSFAAVDSAPAFASEFHGDLGDSSTALPPDSRLEQGFVAVDERLREKVGADPGRASGSTVVGALCLRQGDDFTLKVCNCGDCRCIVVRGPCEEEATAQAAAIRVPRHVGALGDDPAAVRRGGDGPECRWPLIAETVDHKPSLSTERARIEAAGGTVSEEEPPRVDGLLAVSRAIGDFEFKADAGRPVEEQKVSCIPDVYEISGLQKGTIIVLACDGVWDVISGNDLATLVRDRLSADPDLDLGDLATEVINLCLTRNSRDNITCMIAQLVDGSDWASIADEMKGYEKLLPEVKDVVDEDIRAQYTKFLVRCEFQQDVQVCSLCAKWTLGMSQCSCKQVNYCCRQCQKKDWKKHKAVCTAQLGTTTKTGGTE